MPESSSSKSSPSRDGRPFQIWKLRSLVCGADARKDGLHELNEAGAGLFEIADDPRRTRPGRVIRRLSLGELPQLVNVLRGEMSLVGPRPLVCDEDEKILLRTVAHVCARRGM